jgi:tRNA threonylcarbamoyladenosine biosynthesis protein TsaB
LNILALDTSTEWCSVALWLDGRLLSRDERAGQRHSELLLPMIDAVLVEAGLALTDLDGLAFGAGPGSFTGLRIACGVTQGLAFGAGLQVVPVGTLEALAEASAAPRVVAALDARMEEIYHAAYVREGAGWREVHPPCLCAPAAAPALENGEWTGCGNGFAVQGGALRERYAGQLREVRGDLQPHARHMLRIAAERFAQGGGLDPAQAAPLYVRDKVALSVAERAARQALAPERP